MKRYISNYTFLPGGRLLINHITTVGDDGRLISIAPFDRELGNTCYVPHPIVIVKAREKHLALNAIEGARDKAQLRRMLNDERLTVPRASDTVEVIICENL